MSKLYEQLVRVVADSRVTLLGRDQAEFLYDTLKSAALCSEKSRECMEIISADSPLMAIQFARMREALQAFAVLSALGLSEDAFSSLRRFFETSCVLIYLCWTGRFQSYMRGEAEFSGHRANVRDLTDKLPSGMAGPFYTMYAALSAHVHPGGTVNDNTIKEFLREEQLIARFWQATGTEPIDTVSLRTEMAANLNKWITKLLFPICDLYLLANRPDLSPQQGLLMRSMMQVFNKHPKLYEKLGAQHSQNGEVDAALLHKVLMHEGFLDADLTPGPRMALMAYNELIEAARKVNPQALSRLELPEITTLNTLTVEELYRLNGAIAEIIRV